MYLFLKAHAHSLICAVPNYSNVSKGYRPAGETAADKIVMISKSKLPYNPTYNTHFFTRAALMLKRGACCLQVQEPELYYIEFSRICWGLIYRS